MPALALINPYTLPCVLLPSLSLLCSGLNLKPTLNGDTTADTSSHHPLALDQNNNAHAPAAAAVNGVIPYPANPGTSSTDGAAASARPLRAPPGYPQDGSGSSNQGRNAGPAVVIGGPPSYRHSTGSSSFPMTQQQQQPSSGYSTEPPHLPTHTQAAYNNQQQQYLQQAAAAGLRAAHPSYPYPTPPGSAAAGHAADYGMQTPTGAQQQQQQGVLYDEQGSPLPEAAPTVKTDPVELSLLASYLQIVRQTQGDAAAAEAMAASGMTDADGSAPTPFSAAAAAGVFAGGSSAAEGPGPAAAGGSAEEQLAVNNLLGFIKQRKLAGQPPPSSHGRRSSSGSVASVGSAAGGAGAGSSAASRKIWIQPSGECVRRLAWMPACVG